MHFPWWPVGQYPPAPPFKRLGISGVRRRFYGLASVLHGGGGIPGRYDGIFLPVLLGLRAFLHEPLCRFLNTPSPINRRVPRTFALSNVWKARFSKGYFGDELVTSYIAKTPETARFW